MKREERHWHWSRSYHRTSGVRLAGRRTRRPSRSCPPRWWSRGWFSWKRLDLLSERKRVGRRPLQGMNIHAIEILFESLGFSPGKARFGDNSGGKTSPWRFNYPEIEAVAPGGVRYRSEHRKGHKIIRIHATLMARPESPEITMCTPRRRVGCHGENLITVCLATGFWNRIPSGY